MSDSAKNCEDGSSHDCTFLSRQRCLRGRVLWCCWLALGVLHATAPAFGQAEVVQWGHRIAEPAPALDGTIVEVVAGRSFALALEADGGLRAWGRLPGSGSVLPPDPTGWEQLAAGSEHVVGLRVNGTVAAWGRTTSGQCAVPADLGAVRSVAAGMAHSIAVRVDGTVRCWGRNLESQCSVPSGLVGVSRADGGDGFTAALLDTGEVVLWGAVAGQFSLPKGISDLDCMAASVVCLSTEGVVYCVGANGAIECLRDGSPARSIAAGRLHWVAQRVDETIMAFGDNAVGQSTLPASAGSATLLAAGDYSTVFVSPSGAVGWSGSLAPQPLPTGTGAQEIARLCLNDRVGVGRRVDGSTFLWGEDHGVIGALPDPSGPWSDVAIVNDAVSRVRLDSGGVEFHPLQEGYSCTAAAGSLFEFLSPGDDHVLAIMSDGSVECCSNGSFNALAPCELSLSSIVDVSVGSFHAVLLTSDGDVACAGSSNYGQCAVPRGLPLVIDVAAGSVHSVALGVDGAVVAWGDNSFGQLAVPAQAQGLIQVAAGRHHTIGLRSDGEVVAWGSNSKGQCDVPLFEGRVARIDAGPLTSIAFVERVQECPGDLNADRLVDGADLGLLLTAWGTPDADLTGDGSTDGADLGLLISRWGGC